MILRNITFPKATASQVADVVHESFRQRGCEALIPAGQEVAEFSGFAGPSGIVRGTVKLTVFETEDETRVKLELDFFSSNIGGFIAILAAFLSIFTFGVTLLLFLQLRDNARFGLVTEFDRTIGEIGAQLR